jgi:hypothetical protein
VLGENLEFIGTEKCPSAGLSSCNPNGTFVYHWRREINYEELCPGGADGRFCSRCREEFYKTELGCEACVQQTPLLLGVMAGLLCILVI